MQNLFLNQKQIDGMAHGLIACGPRTDRILFMYHGLRKFRVFLAQKHVLRYYACQLKPDNDWLSLYNRINLLKVIVFVRVNSLSVAFLYRTVSLFRHLP